MSKPNCFILEKKNIYILKYEKSMDKHINKWFNIIKLLCVMFVNQYVF